MPAIRADPIKALHITFHRGCQKDLEGVASELSDLIHLTTWYVHDLPPRFFDGTSQGSALYNMGHDRAERIWTRHKDYFATFDLIITSDTVPLSRIFLQNQWKKPLIIWMCNRFDYCDTQSLDCDFPDKEYYQLMRAASGMGNVKIIAYTYFEHYYAKSKNIDTGAITITPCGFIDKDTDVISAIPADIKKENTFFLPPYHNETIYMNLSDHLKKMGISNYCGRYNGPADLEGFKGIICLPYSWSTLALFENLQLGMTYFIPTKKFFRELASKGNYFHPNIHELLRYDLFHLSEWYLPSRRDIFTYFDSWVDLIQKIKTKNFYKQRNINQSYAEEYKRKMLGRWRQLLLNL